MCIRDSRWLAAIGVVLNQGSLERLQRQCHFRKSLVSVRQSQFVRGDSYVVVHSHRRNTLQRSVQPHLRRRPAVLGGGKRLLFSWVCQGSVRKQHERCPLVLVLQGGQHKPRQRVSVPSFVHGECALGACREGAISARTVGRKLV